MFHTQTFTQVWYEWNGGECPVNPDTVVLVKIDYFYRIGVASDFTWERRMGGNNIIAYTTDIFDGNFDHIPNSALKGASDERYC